VEMIEAVIFSHETVVTAGNKLGKDYVAALISLTFFLAPWLYFSEDKFKTIENRRGDNPEWLFHTRKVVTTSVDGDQLRNLWGEIGRLISSSTYPLSSARGGPLTVNQRDISFKDERFSAGSQPLNYLIGRVTATGEGMAGAHASYSLMVIDEASSASDEIYTFAQGWAEKFLIFGNPNKCQNFFYKAVKGGDKPAIA
jgi:hypothetical protein